MNVRIYFLHLAIKIFNSHSSYLNKQKEKDRENIGEIARGDVRGNA